MVGADAKARRPATAGRVGAALGQAAHFGRDHGEAPALFAGARGLDGRIQRQDVGLERDAVDDADDVGDPVGRLRNRAHRVADACAASWLAWRALSAFWRTVAVSSSIDEAVSSSELTCSSVRADKSRLPAAICVEAVAIVSVPARTRATMLARLSCIDFIANSRLCRSRGSSSIATVRLPAAMPLAIATA